VRTHTLTGGTSDSPLRALQDPNVTQIQGNPVNNLIREALIEVGLPSHTHAYTHTYTHTVDRMLAQTCTRLALSMLLHSHCALTAHLCSLAELAPHVSAFSLRSHRASLLSHFQQRVNPGETFVSGQYAVEYSMHNTLDFACVVSSNRCIRTCVTLPVW
jgi:hypothetical protein